MRPAPEYIRDAERAIEDAHLPSLLPAVAVLTGEYAVLGEDLLPARPNLMARHGGMTSCQRDRAGKIVLDALVRFWETGRAAAAPPSGTALEQMIRFASCGIPLRNGYLPLLREELGLAGDDPRAPSWHVDSFGSGRCFSVAVIGAGMSGLLAAHRLRQAGLKVIVLEKNPAVGGTWFDNIYPGCRVDVPSHLYSYSFLQRPDWPRLYSTQDALLDYFRSSVDALGLRDVIRLGTEVLAAEWDDNTAVWTLTVRGSGGDESIRVSAVVSAVGQSRPAAYGPDH